MNIDELVKSGNFAQIMRECFALLEKRHEGVSGMAYKQIVDLRAYLQTLYKAQPKSIKTPSVSIAALAAHAYKFLEDGNTVDNIKVLSSLQFLDAGRKLEQMFEPYIVGYTTLSIFDGQTGLHSADTEPIQTGAKGHGILFDLHEGSEVTLNKIRNKIDTLSPNDPNRETMQKIVDAWAQRQGLKGSDIGES